LRVLALDYGSARCGVAVSDPSGTLATPLEPILRPGTKAGLRRIAALADELAARYPTTEDDRDRVVLAVALTVRSAEVTWSGEYLLDAVGDAGESAMARCVSLPLAFGVTEILAGRLAAGLHQAARDADHAQRWLDFLREHGVAFRFRAGTADTTDAMPSA
jgi:saccharopine dehydrogenase (NADP+, L-glutamate forming)